MRESNIAVLLPCKDEAGTIGDVIRDIRGMAPEFQIYVCDNASADNTAEIAESAGAFIIYEPNPGKGNAMKALFNAVHADCYIMCDGDGTYDTSNIHEMANMVLSGYDFVTGDRLQNGYYDTQTAESHKIGNRFINKAVKALYGDGVSDVLSGYRGMSECFIRSIPSLSGGFTIETEMSIYALTGNYKLGNVSVNVQDRVYGKSKIKVKDGIQIVYTLFALKSKITGSDKYGDYQAQKF